MVRFVKRAIQPNPIEVDYWIDIKTDPYGKVWKYYNGYDWIEFNSDNSNNYFWNHSRIKFIENKSRFFLDIDESEDLDLSIKLRDIGLRL